MRMCLWGIESTAGEAYVRVRHVRGLGMDMAWDWVAWGETAIAGPIRI